jgi:hypothetical protein
MELCSFVVRYERKSLSPVLPRTITIIKPFAVRKAARCSKLSPPCRVLRATRQKGRHDLLQREHEDRSLPESKSSRSSRKHPPAKLRSTSRKPVTRLFPLAPFPRVRATRIVVQIKQIADTKAQNFRIDYHTEICDECKMAEYACVCESHSGGGHKGHTH